MKQFLYKITPTRLGMVMEGATDREAAIIGEHFAYLRRLTGQGTVLLFGRTQNADAAAFGIAIFRGVRGSGQGYQGRRPCCQARRDAG